jgi:quinone-modifying oxidoreductase subunit QmoC
MVSATVAMGEAGELIEPDHNFIREVLRRGGDSVKKCFQCGTCSVTCEMSFAREGAAFPRRQILWTQWGLKDKVLADPAIWQCHQCNDCSANCPRGAKPGDVLAAVRSVAIERFSPPGIVSKLFADPKYLPIAFGIPAAILLILVGALRGLAFPEGEIIYDHYVKSTAIEIAASLVVAYAVVMAGLGVLKFWRELRTTPSAIAAVAAPEAAVPEPTAQEPGDTAPEPAEEEPEEPSDGPGAMTASPTGMSLGQSLISTGTDIALHSEFQQCQTDKLRFFGHLAVFYGTPLLMIAAGIAAIYTFIGAEVQRPPSDVAKIFGNLGGLLVFIGVIVFAYNRLRAKQGTWGRGSYSDWFLISLILLMVVTGALMEIFRYSSAGGAAYSTYIVHLTLVFAFFVYAPNGKFAHTFYRAAAMAFARLRGG